MSTRLTNYTEGLISGYITTNNANGGGGNTWTSCTGGLDGKHYDYFIYDDLIKQPLKEGIEMKNLYEVFLVYGEDRKNPVISATERVIANDDEDARVKSGIYSKIEKGWDADYLTILVKNLGSVKVKEKAKEVKNI